MSAASLVGEIYYQEVSPSTPLGAEAGRVFLREVAGGVVVVVVVGLILSISQRIVVIHP